MKQHLTFKKTQEIWLSQTVTNKLKWLKRKSNLISVTVKPNQINKKLHKKS